MRISSIAYVAIISQLTIISPLHAQGTLDDYRRAYALQRTFTWAKVRNHVDDSRWLSDNRFQYRLTDGTGAANGAPNGLWHFGQVNTDGTITLADTTSSRPIETQSPNNGRHHWGRVRGASTTTRFIANPSKRPHERHWMETDDERSADPVLSPDSSLCAFIRNDNIWVGKPDGSEARQLSTEGTLSNYFSSYIQWSPDSRFVAVNRIRPIDKRYVYYVESSPADQLQPVLHKQEYSKPGDELAQKTPYIFEVATGRALCPKASLIANQYSLDGPTWAQDSHGIRFEYNQRGHKLYRVYEMNATNGDVRTLIEEKAETYVRYSNNWREIIADDHQMLWRSERDGWPHIYLFDLDKGKLIRQVTKGTWCVRQVLKVDEERGLMFFTANGVNADKGEDPYNIHYYSIGLDGNNLTDLTPEPGNHNARFNADFTALIDTYSSVDVAPTTKVRAFGNSFAETTLASADISDLKSSGWRAPEVFMAPGRDGTTPMWGIIQRPTNFDPSRKYPIIEYIYAGPGDSYTPKSFQPYNWYTTSLAELGFIVVQLDAMGTSNRGKAFEEVCYKNLKDAGFPDRMAWIKAAATKYPYMDIDRVGIYGCSAGGQESTTAVLLHPDFYKAAYSACGCHDNRMDKIWWNEQWMGYPVDSSYVACSNVENAHLLTRPLMLVVGELDDNVDPASTMQVANALIRAGKDFELVVIPGAHHTMGETFGEHKRFDFFVRNLIGVTPPAWNEIKN